MARTGGEEGYLWGGWCTGRVLYGGEGDCTQGFMGFTAIHLKLLKHPECADIVGGHPKSLVTWFLILCYNPLVACGT